MALSILSRTFRYFLLFLVFFLHNVVQKHFTIQKTGGRSSSTCLDFYICPLRLTRSAYICFVCSFSLRYDINLFLLSENMALAASSARLLSPLQRYSYRTVWASASSSGSNTALEFPLLLLKINLFNSLK